MKNISVLLIFFPLVVFAGDKPSLTTLWLDLGFLLVVMISLKIAHFSMKNKAIIFITYILAGIITKTIWFPVILWIVMYIYFRNNAPDDTF